MQLVVFEDRLAKNFLPLTLTRPCFSLVLGSMTLLENLTAFSGVKDYGVIVRSYLKDITSSRLSVPVNSILHDEEVLLVNALVRTSDSAVPELFAKKEKFVARQDGFLVAARLHPRDLPRDLSSENVDATRMRSSGSEYDFSRGSLWMYPWELVEANAKGITEQFVARSKGLLVERQSLLGPESSLFISETAEVEQDVTFDVRGGPVFVDHGSKIHSFSRIEGPAYIGQRAILHSALVGQGTSVGRECRIGGEVDASIIAEYSNKAHGGFIGHSYIGEWVNIGALTANSDLKNTYGTVKVQFGNEEVDSRLVKVGCFVGDNCKTSIGTQIYTGLRLGACSHIHGFAWEDVPSFTIYAKSLGGKAVELKLDSAIETQKRMMARRGVEQKPEDRELLKRVFETTQKERYEGGVLKGEFALPA